MAKFRKKPIVIEAVQWRGDFKEIELFMGDKISVATLCVDAELVIRTLEGRMRADLLDWIIKGVNGEFYPCKPDIFEKTYEPE